MATTYEPIATTTLGTATSNYTFSSIPSTYTDLVLIISSTVATVNNSSYIQFNGNASGNYYSITYLSGSGSTTQSGRYNDYNSPYIEWNGVPGASGNPCITIVNIMNYSNTSVNKTFLSRANNSSYGSDAIVGLWRNTAAINSIKIIQPTYNFNVGSTFTLYGIKAA